MNLCHSCFHWRRLKHSQSHGLCKLFGTTKINALSHNGVLSGLTSQVPENFGIPEEGVITGYHFGCIRHSGVKPQPEQPGAFC